jgi:hypothetical protein
MLWSLHLSWNVRELCSLGYLIQNDLNMLTLYRFASPEVISIWDLKVLQQYQDHSHIERDTV